MNDEEIIQRLRKLIGRECIFRDHHWILLDVLAADRLLVLAARDRVTRIQQNQFGQASRQVPETLQVRIFDEDSGGFSETLIELLESLSAA